MRNLLIIIGLLVFTGCTKDFTDKSSLVNIPEENFWKTEQDAVLAINGIYDVLQDRAMYSGSLNDGPSGLTQFDGLGDNCFNNYKFEGPGNYMEGNITPSHSLFAGLWASSYRGIFRANDALEKIPTIASISDTRRTQLMAQVYFLRGLFYYNLAVHYGSVPMPLKNRDINERNIKKSTYAELTAQILSDLNLAVAGLPNSYPAAQFGYATKGAALGLLARFNLYNKDYQGVLDATATLLTMGYGLFNNYAQLFTEATAAEQSNEIVFSVRFLQDAQSSNGEVFSATFLQAPRINMQPMPNLVKDYYCTDGKPITTSPLYNPGTPANNSPQKLNRDPRLLASVIFRNDIFLTDLNRAFIGNTATGYGQKKYIRSTSVSPLGIQAFSPGGQDYYVIRYADVLLMRAEAFIELNQLASAYPLINQVRARVSMPSIESVEGPNRTQAELRDILRHERRVELAFEGLRYFDLKRWGQLQAAYATATSDAVAGYRPLFQSGKAGVFPIPESELNANWVIGQNPVWQ